MGGADADKLTDTGDKLTLDMHSEPAAKIPKLPMLLGCGAEVKRFYSMAIQAYTNTKGKLDVKLTRDLDEIHKLALKLESKCQTHPKSGCCFFRRLQGRYIAVVPALGTLLGDSDDGGCENNRAASEVARWCKGHLAYWKDEA